MNNFFAVQLGHKPFYYYFLDLENAKRCVWDYYYNNIGYLDTEKEREAIKTHLEQYLAIPFYGAITTHYFEDYKGE